MRDQHYHAGDASPAFSLRWAWTGWPSADVFPNPSSIDWKLLESLSVVPSMIVARLKGRLDHAFRTKGIPLKFSRKVALRSLGENTQAGVDQYIANQVDKEQFVDDRFGASLKEFTRVWQSRAADPLEVNSGRYWYQLHLVLVVDKRHRIVDLSFLGKMFESFQEIAIDAGYELSALSVMPDHTHVALRGVVSQSPEAIAVQFQNGIESHLRVNSLWQPSYYVGTFGAYNMKVVRTNRE